MLFFWQDAPLPTGGLKQAYRQVEVLHHAGIEARAQAVERTMKWIDSDRDAAAR
ncbi:MAG: hypothetical protein AAGF92_10010 [Myxococcota bacterium]